MTDQTFVRDLEKVIETAQLPALPQSAIGLLELSQDPNNGPAEFAIPIESDPGLASQVLRFVNSSYFGFSHEISNVKLAINMIGVRTVKNFSLWSAVFSLMPDPKCGPFRLQVLWRDSLYRGLFARILSRKLGLKDVEEAFAAALLQDMAIPLLAKQMSPVYAKLLETTSTTHYRLSELEQKYFDWNHARAGALICEHWNLPEEFGQLIQCHTELHRWIDDPNSPEATLAVGLSAFLPSIASKQWKEYEIFCDYFRRIKKSSIPEIKELFDMVDKHFTEVAPILKINTEGPTLVNWLDDPKGKEVSKGELIGARNG